MSDTLSLDAYWMPYTGNRQFKRDPRIIVGAQGVWFTDDQGRQILDGHSGLWTSGLGHGHPEVSQAVAHQIETLDFCPPFQFGHPTAFELANRLKALMPEGLDYVFYTNSGSESADTSLKMARAYWRLKGQPAKTRFIGRQKGYHGVNYGGTAVGGIGANRKPFGPSLEVDHLRHTMLPENQFCRGMPEYGAHLADELSELITLHDASTIAAVIVEPMAGSAGVIPPPVGYLRRLRELCDANDILLIFDEVITGLGRCGAYTGAEAFGVTPDILNLAKQITNGAVPMGAVVATAEIYDTFMAHGGPDYALEFAHGYTYSGHPVACAAGIAALDILVRDEVTGARGAGSPILGDVIARWYRRKAPCHRCEKLWVCGSHHAGAVSWRAIATSFRGGHASLGKRVFSALRGRYDPTRTALCHAARADDLSGRGASGNIRRIGMSVMITGHCESAPHRE
jgi:beta-alanine--pyruvate transaminase